MKLLLVYAIASVVLIAFNIKTYAVMGLLQLKTLKLRAHEGDKVYIPCRNPPGLPIYLWKIGESVYPVSQLPRERGLEATSNGLLVHYAHPNIGGIYNCYTRQNGTQEVSEIHFEVQKKNLTSFMNNANTEDAQSRDTHLQLKVTKGDVVFIPCGINFAEENIIWYINKVVYPIFNLPENHFLIDSGIVVSNISFPLNSVTYECYGQSRRNDSFQKQYTVSMELSEFIPQEHGHEIYDYYSKSEQLELVIRDVTFNETYYNFEFKFNNETTTARVNDCHHGNTISTMVIKNNAQKLWNTTSVKYPPKFSTPAEIFKTDLNSVANVNTTKHDGHLCADLNYEFRVERNDSEKTNYCQPEGDTFCIPLPDNWKHMNDLLLIIWPRELNSDEDCTCPLVQILDFGDCYCFKMNLTNYKVEPVENETRICWKNLTRATHLTNVLIAFDYRYSNVVKRTFRSQIQLVVEGYASFGPFINQSETGTVCIQSNSSSNWSPVTEIDVMVYDNTSDVILNATFDGDYVCPINFQDFPPVCAPFNINATVHTLCRQSSTTMLYNPGTGNTNYCDCIQAKANISMTVQQVNYNSVALLFKAQCILSYNAHISRISHLHLEFAATSCDEKTSDCVMKSVPFGVICNKNTSLLVDQLVDGTTYNLSVVWISPSSNALRCKVLESVSVDTDWFSPLKIGLIAGASVIIVLLFLVLPIITIKCWKSLRTKKKYTVGGIGSTETLDPSSPHINRYNS